MSITMERLRDKLQQYYNEERNKGKNEVVAKYNAVQSTLFYILGLIEHFSEWEDMEAIKSVTKHYQQLELYAFDQRSTEYMEQKYQQHCSLQSG